MYYSNSNGIANMTIEIRIIRSEHSRYFSIEKFEYFFKSKEKNKMNGKKIICITRLSTFVCFLFRINSTKEIEFIRTTKKQLVEHFFVLLSKHQPDRIMFEQPSMASLSKGNISFLKRSRTSKIKSSSNNCRRILSECEKRSLHGKTQTIIHVSIRPTRKNHSRLHSVKIFFDHRINSFDMDIEFKQSN